VVAAVVALTATWAGGGFEGGGGPGSPLEFRSETGWTLSYPGALHRRAFDMRGFGFHAYGVAVGNFDPLPEAVSPDDPRPLHIPARGVLFQLYVLDGDLDAPLGSKGRLPLTVRDFAGFGNAPAMYLFTANGYGFAAVAAAGRDASPSDRQALSRTIQSVRLPRLRVGQITGSVGFYVAKRLSAYPLGSVTGVHPAKLSPFYVINDRHGLRVVGWQGLACDVQLDRARRQFFCPGGGRWDSFGNTIVNPPAAKQIEPLVRYATATSQGHLLVTERVAYVAGCAAALARTVRDCPNYQPVSSSSRTS